MQHYPRNDPYEREPLDPAYDDRYQSPSRRPQYNQYGHESPYHDDSPGRTPEPALHYHQTPYDSVPRHHPAPPPPPHMNMHPHDGSPSRQHADDYHHAPPTDSSASNHYGYSHPAALSANAYNPDSTRTAGQVLPPPSRASVPDSSSSHPSLHSSPYAAGYAMDGDSRSAVNPFGTVAGSSVGSRSPSTSPHASGDRYITGQDTYYNHPTSSRGPLGMVDPNSIADDDDDGLDYSRRSNGNSARGGSKRAVPAAIGAAAGGATAVAAEHDSRAYYEPAKREQSSDWLEKKQARSKKWKCAIIFLVFLVIVGAVVGGVVGTFVAGRKDNGKSNSGSGSALNDDASGDLGLKSPEIQKLLNNKNLHRVFPGMDYTPIHVQYPECLTNPPSQNNVTRDVAVLSQLTNKIRLYGTDCNQTQMVLHAIERLEMKNDVKIWMGIWQDGNTTTNERQLSQMWQILDQYGGDSFEGVIVANEILFRKEMSSAQLSSLLSDVRANLAKRGLNLPVATSDLGDDWTTALAADSDLIMANIHPFFSGTPAESAAEWTYSFWQNKNGPMWKPDKKNNVISETGWPSAGGIRCPIEAPQCTNPSKAGIPEMNRFMADWVCAALQNGTNYFWFEAFDEPWKVRFNTDKESWEDKWGLMDVNRNLKPGVKIPDCGGATVS